MITHAAININIYVKGNHFGKLYSIPHILFYFCHFSARIFKSMLYGTNATVTGNSYRAIITQDPLRARGNFRLSENLLLATLHPENMLPHCRRTVSFLLNRPVSLATTLDLCFLSDQI